VLGTKMLFLTLNPKAMMWMVSEQSHSAFEFIDMQKVIKLIFEENFNILVVIYIHHENNLPYFAIFRLTMSSVRQLVRNEVIPELRPTTRLTLFPVTSDVMGVILYDIETHEVQNSYFYYLDGPFYQHSNFEEPVRIDDRQFFMQFQEDYKFNTNLVKYLADKVITLDKFQNSKTIGIQKYIEIIGNIRDISIAGEYAGKNQISMRRPLSLFSETYIGTCDGHDCNEVTLGSDKDFIIFRISDDKPHFTIRAKNRLHNPHNIIVSLPDLYMCQELLLSNKKVLCFWMEGAKARMTIQFIEVTENRTITFDLPVAVEKPIILYDHAGTIIVAFVDRQFYRQVGIYQFSWKEEPKTDSTSSSLKVNSDIKWLQISSKELLCDELKIKSYAAFSHVESDMLYVIVLDAWTNSLYLFKSSLREKKEIPTLKNNIALDHLDVLFYHLSCEFDADQITFDCFLFSANYIFRIKISISLDTSISDYKWVFETKARFYNAIYESTLDNDFQIEMRTFGNKVIVFEKHPYVESQKGLIFYDLDSANPNHSNFIYDLSSHENILDIMFEPALNQIHIYFTEKNTIRRTALAISEYAIDIVNIARTREGEDEDDEDRYDGGIVLNKDLEIVIEFKNNNRYTVAFSFDNKKVAEEKGKTDKTKTTPILLLAVLVVSVLILSLVLSLVILLEKKKRYEMRLIRLQLPVDETQSMLSDSR
jgi:hypothetical protein